MNTRSRVATYVGVASVIFTVGFGTGYVARGPQEQYQPTKAEAKQVESIPADVTQKFLAELDLHKQTLRCNPDRNTIQLFDGSIDTHVNVAYPARCEPVLTSEGKTGYHAAELQHRSSFVITMNHPQYPTTKSMNFEIDRQTGRLIRVWRPESSSTVYVADISPLERETLQNYANRGVQFARDVIKRDVARVAGLK